MAGAKRTIEEARAIADWVETQKDGRYRADVLRRLCRSREASTQLNRVLHRDNKALRDRLAPLAAVERRRNRVRAGLVSDPIVVELELVAGQLEDVRLAFEAAGGDGSIPLADPAALIDLLNRAREALR